MKKIIPALLFAVFSVTPAAILYADTRWQGFGAQSTLKVGGVVIPITTLADSGPGSLRACLRDTRPRVCVFSVAGRIKLASAIDIVAPNILIAGQTAPDPGILISNSGINVLTHDVVIEHLQIRPGDETTGTAYSERDAMSVKPPAYNVVLNQLSLSWGVDENFSIAAGAAKNVTIQNSIIAEGLYNSKHPKGPHSMGVLVNEGARNISFIRNLLAYNKDRNIRWKYNTTGEMVNNAIYDWGDSQWNTTNLTDLENKALPTTLDIIGNVFVPGPDSRLGVYAVYAEDYKASKGSKLFLLDNLGPTRKSGESEWKITNLQETTFKKTVKLTGAYAQTILPAGQLPGAIVSNVGSRPWNRNSVDARIITGTLNRTGTIKDCVSGCTRHAGGWPVMTPIVPTPTVTAPLATPTPVPSVTPAPAPTWPAVLLPSEVEDFLEDYER